MQNAPLLLTLPSQTIMATGVGGGELFGKVPFRGYGDSSVAENSYRRSNFLHCGWRKHTIFPLVYSLRLLQHSSPTTSYVTGAYVGAGVGVIVGSGVGSGVGTTSVGDIVGDIDGMPVVPIEVSPPGPVKAMAGAPGHLSGRGAGAAARSVLRPHWAQTPRLLDFAQLCCLIAFLRNSASIAAIVDTTSRGATGVSFLSSLCAIYCVQLLFEI